MMPHLERSFLEWQWPWLPSDMKDGVKESPWIQVFQNARAWCDGVKLARNKSNWKKGVKQIVSVKKEGRWF
jgi:hypothetical protein